MKEYNMGLIGEIIALFLVAIPIVSQKQDPLFEEIVEKMGDPTVVSDRGMLWKKDGIKICLFREGVINNRLRITVPLTKEQNDPEKLMCLGFHNQLRSTITIKGNSWQDISNIIVNDL